MELLVLLGLALFIVGAIIAIPAQFDLTFCTDLDIVETMAAKHMEGVGAMIAALGILFGVVGALA